MVFSCNCPKWSERKIWKIHAFSSGVWLNLWDRRSNVFTHHGNVDAVEPRRLHSVTASSRCYQVPGETVICIRELRRIAINEIREKRCVRNRWRLYSSLRTIQWNHRENNWIDSRFDLHLIIRMLHVFSSFPFFSFAPFFFLFNFQATSRITCSPTFNFFFSSFFFSFQMLKFEVWNIVSWH